MTIQIEKADREAVALYFGYPLGAIPKTEIERVAEHFARHRLAEQERAALIAETMFADDRCDVSRQVGGKRIAAVIRSGSPSVPHS
jgi:hypothetical protein